MTTLIFPANNQAGMDYAAAAKERGETFILATSSEDVFGRKLPYIHEPEFEGEFFNLCADSFFTIDRVFCPVASVYAFMKKFLAIEFPFIRLIGKSPIQQELDKHRTLMARAKELSAGTNMSVLEIAAILKHAAAIYGESNDDKLGAMMRLFGDAPKGRVVEIGSLAGRTAWVLCYLANYHNIGNVITIDPWSAKEGVQYDSPPTLTCLTLEWDWDALAEMFAINMLPFAYNHSHLREPSEAAFTLHPKLGEIAVLHIDGNHDYDSVRCDCELWCSRMLPGGWLVLDDYVWAHGDGPKRAGDELLARNADNIEQHFEAGKALFVKFKGEPK